MKFPEIINKFKTYWKGKVHVKVRRNIEGDIESFTITICRFNKCKGLFGKIDWNDSEYILDQLKSTKHSVLLELDLGFGESTLYIPKWAKKHVIGKIEQYREEDGKKK